MIKALFLIFEPGTAWDSAAQRSLKYTLCFYLLPMLLIVGTVEGFGLVEWGRWQSALSGIKQFTVGEAILSEAGQMTLMLVVMGISAYLIKAFGETFHGKHTYHQAITVVVYGVSPIFLFRLLDVFPNMDLMVPWAVAALLMVKILYHGVPRVMQPDPPHAFGLFFMSALLLVMITGVERYLSRGYLMGKFKPLSEVVTQILTHIGHRLHLQ